MTKRPFGKVFKAFFNKQFYIAFINIFKNFDRPLNVLNRYIFGRGAYPDKRLVMTPIGKLELSLYSFHDMITLVECFGKLDYQADNDLKCVVDFGSNIGISAGYFLTRNNNSKVYLFEPLPDNVSKLKANLERYESRYELKEVAVGLKNGVADFGYETTGRYGGLQSSCLKKTQVKVLMAEEVISKILAKEGHIDVLKIDVEGLEVAIIQSLSSDSLKRIDRIYAETIYPENLPGFQKEQYGGIVRFSKALNN